jgi:superfamily II DNA or RNA helicase
MATFTHLFDQLDPDDKKRRGTQFEHVTKLYLETDPIYSQEFKRVWLWNEWPGRWGKDKGIDLVAVRRDGTLRAIQSKAHAETTPVTMHHMSQFLAESARKNPDGTPVFHSRLLVATTDLVGVNATDVADWAIIPVSIVRRRDLDNAPIDWPSSLSDLRAKKLPRKTPTGDYVHQGEAMKNVVKGFNNGATRGQMIMACGTGKTLASLFIKEKLNAQRVLIMVPSISLMKQSISEWTANSKVPFAILPVCSDDTVRDKDDIFASTVSELGLPATTGPVDIAAFLRKPGPRVMFATYQSSPEIAKAFALGRVPAFDLVIADEAHRTVGPDGSSFATVLDNQKIKAKRRLFMTATPRVFSARVKRACREKDFEIASMDDEAKYGKVFHYLSFGEAIERGLLTDYQIVVVGVTDPEYLAWAKEGLFVTLDGVEAKDARSIAGAIGVAKTMRKYCLYRGITFHTKVDSALESSHLLPEVVAWMPPRQRPKGDLWCAHASGKMTAGERGQLLDQLRDLYDADRGVLSNARCLTEGIDVPIVDFIAFMDPKRSKVDIQQAFGRAVRPAHGKSIATIIIPVFIDDKEARKDPKAGLNDSKYDTIWETVRALREVDERLADEIDAIRRGIGTHKKISSPTVISLDVPQRHIVGADFANAFNVHLVEMTSASFEEYFGALEQFIRGVGHALVPTGYVTDNGLNLGMWVANQRSLKGRDKLPLEYVERLDNLPGWAWNAYEAKWNEGLLRYQANPTDKWSIRWAINLRSIKDTLCADRVKQLDAIDFEWAPHDTAFAEFLSELRKYHEREGHTLVRSDYKTDDGYPLGKGVIRWRARKDTLFTYRVAQLDAIGFEWNGRNAMWMENYVRHQRWNEQNGPGPARAGTMFEGVQLGTWDDNLRSAYRRGDLSADRIELLKKLPGWTWTGTRKVRRWTPQEDAAISKCRPPGHGPRRDAHLERLSQELGRSYDSVKQRCWILSKTRQD